LKPGSKIGQLTLVKKINGEKKWMCKCDCGQNCIKTLASLYHRRPTLSCGCSLFGTRDYHPGDKIGRLTLIKRIGQDEKWQCLCDCGSKCNKSFSSIWQNRDTSSCGCSMYQYEKGNKSYKWNGFGEISSRVWSGIIGNARRRGIDLNVTIDDAWNRFIEQGRRCALSGTLISFPKSSDDEITASLDRIDSNLPYNNKNVQWIHKDINDMKFDLDEDEFLYYCYLIINPISHNDINDSCCIGEKHKNWRGFGNISKNYWSQIVRNAKKRNIILNIKISDLWNKFLEQGGYCAVTGLPLYLPRYGRKHNASLDRIDNDRGYEIDNIQWVHKIINTRIKGSLDEHKMRYWCNKIINYRGYSR
jgi:hypothetical protein